MKCRMLLYFGCLSFAGALATTTPPTEGASNPATLSELEPATNVLEQSSSTSSQGTINAVILSELETVPGHLSSSSHQDSTNSDVMSEMGMTVPFSLFSTTGEDTNEPTFSSEMKTTTNVPPNLFSTGTQETSDPTVSLQPETTSVLISKLYSASSQGTTPPSPLSEQEKVPDLYHFPPTSTPETNHYSSSESENMILQDSPYESTVHSKITSHDQDVDVTKYGPTIQSIEITSDSLESPSEHSTVQNILTTSYPATKRNHYLKNRKSGTAIFNALATPHWETSTYPGDHHHFLHHGTSDGYYHSILTEPYSSTFDYHFSNPYLSHSSHDIIEHTTKRSTTKSSFLRTSTRRPAFESTPSTDSTYRHHRQEDKNHGYKHHDDTSKGKEQGEKQFTNPFEKKNGAARCQLFNVAVIIVTALMARINLP